MGEGGKEEVALQEQEKKVGGLGERNGKGVRGGEGRGDDRKGKKGKEMREKKRASSIYQHNKTAARMSTSSRQEQCFMATECPRVPWKKRPLG